MDRVRRARNAAFQVASFTLSYKGKRFLILGALAVKHESFKKVRRFIGSKVRDRVILNSLSPNPKPQAQTPNPKPQTPNPKPQTLNPKPQTPNPNSHMAAQRPANRVICPCYFVFSLPRSRNTERLAEKKKYILFPCST